jgi:hypothetical protein
MEAMRQSWTDDRLDDFRADVDRRFDEVDKRFNRLELRMDGGFNALRVEMNQGFARIDERFDKMQRIMIQFCGGAILTLIAALVSLVATQL